MQRTSKAVQQFWFSDLGFARASDNSLDATSDRDFVGNYAFA